MPHYQAHADAGAVLMRRRRVSGLLLDKALASVRKAVGAFNAMDDDGRSTAVLLHLQHAAEMLLKAGLSEKRAKVFDGRTGRSIGFEKCLALASEHLNLSAEEAGTLRALDALRDDEQHWLGELSEELLFLHVRAVVQVLDTVMTRAFGEGLADHLPDRALPVTTRPLQEFDVLVDRQYSQINDLLATGKRRTPEARALIRGLLAMEGHVSEDARVSERDVDRVMQGVRGGKPVEDVFPRLRTLDAKTSGDGPSVTVHFAKKGGAPVTFVAADDPSAAAAVRELDLQRKYHLSATDLAEKVGLTANRATALRRHLGIDKDPACRHEFVFGAAKHVVFSDNARRAMQEALDGGVDMDEVWAKHGWGGRRR
jgi:hypothetical protein